MPRRTFLIFWTAVAVAVLLLGGGVATFRRILASGMVIDDVVLSLAILGLSAALLVAGRIVLVSARVQRRARRGITLGRSAGPRRASQAARGGMREMVKDPICGMSVEPAAAAESTRNGTKEPG